MATGSKTQKVTQKTELDEGTQALNKMRLDLETEMRPLREQILESLQNPQFTGPSGLMLPSANMNNAFEKLFAMRNIPRLEAQRINVGDRFTELLGKQNTESKRLFEELTLPGIMNKMNASGFGRSGAQNEVMRKAALDMTMPLLDREMGIENQRLMTQLGLEREFNATQLGLDQARLGMSRESEANIINAIMNLENSKMAPMLGLMGASIPFTPAPTMVGKTSSSSSGFDFTSLIPMAGAAIGSYFGGPMGGMAGGQAGGAIAGAMGGGQQGTGTFTAMPQPTSIGGGSNIWNQPNRFSIMG